MAKTPAQLKRLLGRSSRADRGGGIHLSIEGDAYDPGFQHGYHLAGELREAIGAIRALVELDEQVSFDWVAQNAEATFRPRLERDKRAGDAGKEILAELNGIVDGANENLRAGVADGSPNPAALTLVDVIGWNAYPEMICQW